MMTALKKGGNFKKLSPSGEAVRYFIRRQGDKGTLQVCDFKMSIGRDEIARRIRAMRGYIHGKLKRRPVFLDPKPWPYENYPAPTQESMDIQADLMHDLNELIRRADRAGFSLSIDQVGSPAGMGLWSSRRVGVHPVRIIDPSAMLIATL